MVFLPKSPIACQIRTFSDLQWLLTANQYEVVVTTDLGRINPIGRARDAGGAIS